MSGEGRVNARRRRVPARAASRIPKAGDGAGRKRPRLGQNFLADRGAAERIVDALGDISGLTVLEIGAGRGALTENLASRARRLIAIELDRLLATALRMRFRLRPNVEVVEGDVRSMDLSTLVAGDLEALRDRSNQAPAKARVVGNLPYYITSDILLRLFSFHQHFDLIVIMVQREVAERIAARPGSRDYGLLSATAQLFARVEKLFTLPPRAFTPPPQVHSTVLRLALAPQAQTLRVEADDFINFLKLSFGQKRKTLVNNLKARYPEEKVRQALRAAAARPDVRAEALSLEKAAAVFRALAQ